MSLNIMIAGCPKDERDRVEASVRAAMGGVAETAAWNVSLVNVANQWSIDIDGPEPNFKGLSLSATNEDLSGSLARALADAKNTAANTPVPASAPAATAGQRHDQHACEECAVAFQVIFDASDGEPEELCPVACPACWHVNKVPIAEAAGATGDYKAQPVT